MLDGWLDKDGQAQIYIEAVTIGFISLFLLEALIHIIAFKGLYFNAQWTSNTELPLCLTLLGLSIRLVLRFENYLYGLVRLLRVAVLIVKLF